MSVPMQNFIACLGMILFIIMVVPTTWLLERHGLRIAVSQEIFSFSGSTFVADLTKIFARFLLVQL